MDANDESSNKMMLYSWEILDVYFTANGTELTENLFQIGRWEKQSLQRPQGWSSAEKIYRVSVAGVFWNLRRERTRRRSRDKSQRSEGHLQIMGSCLRVIHWNSFCHCGFCRQLRTSTTLVLSPRTAVKSSRKKDNNPFPVRVRSSVIDSKVPLQRPLPTHGTKGKRPRTRIDRRQKKLNSSK